jgi:hypothetical protein
LPALRLPREGRRVGAGAVLAFAAHAAIVIALLWRGAEYLGGGGGGAGPRGGGGGGGRPAVRFFALPAFSTPTQVDVQAPPVVSVAALTLPDPTTLNVPPVEVPKVAIQPSAPVGTGNGNSGGPGQGPGTGGGQGTGAGPGAGADTGSGRGGEAGYILRADPRTMLVPPECARGRFSVKFWVEANGRVSRVDIDPLPKDSGCRSEFLAKMRGYQFKPARTRDGQPVASIYPVQITR